MRRIGIALLLGSLILAVAAFGSRLLRETAPFHGEGIPAAIARSPVPVAATLSCEFTNFAARTPRVGFYFAIVPGERPVFAQISQQEQDGTESDFGVGSKERPQWSFNGAGSLAVITSPDESIKINLYDYDPNRSGATWFEAGLRGIRYLNLGGRCRQSAT